MRLLTVFFAVFFHIVSLIPTQASAAESHLNWLTNYEEAVSLSRTTSKPLILFFTGSDWCGWCTRLEKEVLDTPDFIDATKDRFVFLKLDFPMNTTLHPQLTAQNKELQKKYEIRGFPTLVVLDSQQQKIGTIGYQPGGGTKYAASLTKMVSDYIAYTQKMQTLNQHSMSGDELKELYEKAVELNLINDANKVVKEGVQSDKRIFFLVEHYHFLAEEGLIHHDEAVSLRQQLFALDPENHNGIQYKIAVIDFEACCQEMERENYSAELAVAPLVQYINKYGQQDQDNLWRLQMIISQVFLDKNKIKEALSYAKSSYDTAPPSVKAEIYLAIQNILTLLPNHV